MFLCIYIEIITAFSHIKRVIKDELAGFMSQTNYSHFIQTTYEEDGGVWLTGAIFIGWQWLTRDSLVIESNLIR